jgi:sRNA-binding carbon storage regulator CsrA
MGLVLTIMEDEQITIGDNVKVSFYKDLHNKWKIYIVAPDLKITRMPLENIPERKKKMGMI